MCLPTLIELQHSVMTFVETDQAIEYSSKKGLTQLKYKWNKGKHIYRTEFYPAQHYLLRYVLFPGVISCHLVIGYNAISDTYWFAHVSGDQIGSGYISEYFKQAPPAYAQFLGANYNNTAAILSDQKTNFVVIDKADFFNQSLFSKTLENRIKSIKLVRPEITYGHTSIFICYDLLQKKIFFIKDPFIKSDYPSSVIKLHANFQEDAPNYQCTKEDQKLIKFIENVLLGLTPAIYYENITSN